MANDHLEIARNEMCNDNNRANFIQQDWSDIKGEYDRISCIGCMEHVGRDNAKIFFNTIHHCLKENGIFVLHTIGDNITRFEVDRWLSKWIFPEGYIPSIKLIMELAEGLFITEDVHNLNDSYEKTLIEWDRNFVDNWEDIKSAHPELNNEEFYRMWRYYLLLSAAMYRSKRIQLFQVVFTRIEDKKYYPTPQYSW